MKNSILVLILAAGKGSRLKHNLPKPLVPIAKVPMIHRILNVLITFKELDISIVVGYRGKEIQNSINEDISYIFQKNPIGTADAVKESLHQIKNYKHVLIMTADSGLIKKKTIQLLLDDHLRMESDCSFLTSIFPLSLPYARVIRKNEAITNCIEEIDATTSQLKVTELFTSHYILKVKFLLKYIKKIKKNKISGECNLIDIIQLMIADSCNVNGIKIDDYKSLMGINTLKELELAENWLEQDNEKN